MNSGLTVADNLAQLWRSFSLEYELFRGVIGWVPRIASYDVKCKLVEHLHEDMRRTRALRERIADFGVFSPERQVDAALANLVRHLLQAPFDGALVGAFYRTIKTLQAEGYRRHLRATLRLNDAPTVAVLEEHLPRLDRQIAWACELLDGPALPTALARQVSAFEDEIEQHVAALGGLFHVEGRTGVTGGSSIAELEASLAGSMSPEDIAELTANALALRGDDSTQRRNGKAARNGHVTATFPVAETDQLMLVTDKGQTIRIPVDGIRVTGRNTQGVKLFHTDADEHVVSVARLSDAENGDEAEEVAAEG